jgi:hypothetical protein
MEKMIKALLFSYGDEQPNPLAGTQGQPDTVVREGLARLGQVVDVTRPYDLERGERLGAFFSDEDRKAVEEGTYKGVDAPAVATARLAEAQAIIQDTTDDSTPAESRDISGMSAEEVADLIKPEEGKPLNVDETVALADPSDVDSINKVLDAENIASENDPRTGVVKSLEAKLAAATTG